jgi:hypothetical protein
VINDKSNTPSTPRPDPTTLTTQQLDKGLDHLREILNIKVESLQHSSDLADKAIEDQHKAFVVEVNQRFHELSAKSDINRSDINTLRESRAAVAAGEARSVVERERRAWSVGQTITVVSSAVAVLVSIAAIIATMILRK